MLAQINAWIEARTAELLAEFRKLRAQPMSFAQFGDVWRGLGATGQKVILIGTTVLFILIAIGQCQESDRVAHEERMLKMTGVRKPIIVETISFWRRKIDIGPQWTLPFTFIEGLRCVDWDTHPPSEFQMSDDGHNWSAVRKGRFIRFRSTNGRSFAIRLDFRDHPEQASACRY